MGNKRLRVFLYCFLFIVTFPSLVASAEQGRLSRQKYPNVSCKEVTERIETIRGNFRGYFALRCGSDWKLVIDTESIEGRYFQIASLSKAWIGQALHELSPSAEGFWQQSMGTLFPEMNFPDSLLKKTTLGELARHRSGLRTSSWRRQTFASSSKEDIRAFLFENSSIKGAGRFRYSNTGYALLSMAFEEISGQDWTNWVEEVIFPRLGVKQARVMPTENDLPSGSFFQAKRWLGFASVPFFWNNGIGRVALMHPYGGDGYVLATPDTMKKWLGFHLASPLSLSRSVDRLKEGGEYFGGWVDDRDELGWLWHNGFLGLTGHYSLLGVNHESQVGFVLLGAGDDARKHQSFLLGGQSFADQSHAKDLVRTVSTLVVNLLTFLLPFLMLSVFLNDLLFLIRPTKIPQTTLLHKARLTFSLTQNVPRAWHGFFHGGYLFFGLNWFGGAQALGFSLLATLIWLTVYFRQRPQKQAMDRKVLLSNGIVAAVCLFFILVRLQTWG